MTLASSFAVKVCLGEEIRRFQVPPEVNWDELKDKVCGRPHSFLPAIENVLRMTYILEGIVCYY